MTEVESANTIPVNRTWTDEPPKAPKKDDKAEAVNDVNNINSDPSTPIQTSIIQSQKEPIDAATIHVPIEPEVNDKLSTTGEDTLDDRGRTKTFEIYLQPDSEDNSEDQIYYLPLAVGTRAMTPNENDELLPSLSSIISNFSGPDKLLRDLSDTISYTNRCTDDKSQPDLTQSEDSGSKFTLYSENLSKTKQIPESITQKFNQIAKMNKNSLRSRRTVRTSITRINPKISAPSNTTISKSPSAESGTGRTTTSLTREGSHTLLPNISQMEPKPIHTRFHSDGPAPMIEFPIQTSKSFIESHKSTGSSSTTESNASSNQPSRKPTTYIRSSTADRLPVIARISPTLIGTTNNITTATTGQVSGVLRSKSAAGTSVPKHSFSKSVNIATVDPMTISVCSPSSLPENMHDSQTQSSGHTNFRDGSTNSLPSLSTGDSSINEESLDAADGAKLTSPPILETSSAIMSVQHNQTSSSTTDQKIGSTNDSILAKRRHIVRELIQVEKEYVNALATLVNVYMLPLKQEKILDDQQAEAIFFKVNELFNLHMSFLNTLQLWDRTNTVGDKLLDMFSREAAAACYCAFVDNYPNAEKLVDNLWNTKSSFQKFCEQKPRQQRTKLPLKSLLVQPVQRIPRYELLVKRLLEYTPATYSDNPLLKEALSAIHRLAVHVDSVRSNGQDESLLDGTKLLEKLVSPATLTPNRAYIRHDTVSMEERKDPVCIFMFTDQIVFTIAKRRGSQIPKKPVILRLQSPKGVDTIENIKFKIFHRLAIEAIEFEVDTDNDNDRLVQHREIRDKKDLALLAEIENISTRLDYRHQELDSVVRQLYQNLQKELEELRYARNTMGNELKNISIFRATMKEGVEHYELTFPNNEKRVDWERTIMELKPQLSSVKRTPRFHSRVEIPRILSGVKLSCAAVVEVFQMTRSTPRDVWICAADGYTGYICLLTLKPKPTICLNTPLSGCNSRITCVCAVPEYPRPGSRRHSGTTGSVKGSPRSNVHVTFRSRKVNPPAQLVLDEQTNLDMDSCIPSASSPKTPTVTPAAEVLNSPIERTEFLKDLTKTQEEGNIKTISGLPINLSSAEPEQELNKTEIIDATEVNDKPKELDRMIEEKMADTHLVVDAAEQDNATSDYSDSSDTSEGDVGTGDQELSDDHEEDPTGEEELRDSGYPKDVSSGLTRTTRSPKVSTVLCDIHRPTMWLGTQDGSIFIFYATDELNPHRQRKYITLPSAINSILHLESRIFVACSNGDLYVYDRNISGAWDLENPRSVTIRPDSDEPVVVGRMLAVAGNIWCAAHRFIYVLSSVSLEVELSFPLNGNPADPRGIQLMAYGNQTVWLATENSSRVSLYHATTGEFLMEIDLKPVVLQSLQQCDEIIMRHKEACLRITCLTVCKDLLWVGTSAGVIVTVAIPRVSLASTQSTMEQPMLEILRQGHIGNVRFLVNLESISEPENNVITTKEAIPPTVPETPINKSATAVSAADRTTKHPSFEQNSSSIDETLIEESNSQMPTITIECPRSDKKPVIVTTEHGSDPPGPSHQTTSADTASLQAVIHSAQRHHLLGVRRSSINPCGTIAAQLKVLSGGDGYANFVSTSSPSQLLANIDSQQTANLGDNDVTNHILIWDIH